MPHINRIRVNNVKYNFGTQFYDDFIMRFDGKNVLYDLANGGGKSVLLLLLLQNLIPNCTLDDKQPVEKLFRGSNGSTVIHSLIEWKLDDYLIRDDYRYMLTGFCARKAREEEGQNAAREVAAIEYFNYVIFYRHYNDNDIVNLPLSDGKERITYPGLKTYLRNLGRKDYQLQVYVFERKGEYQRFISQYGLYESEWEIIRGINKTEGHVRTYFESRYRTTRKVVEDLLIEEIIQKAFAMRTAQRTSEVSDSASPEQAGNSDSGDTALMADTLYQIKDQLSELTRRKEEMHHYDRQQEVLQSLGERIGTLDAMYQEESALQLDIVKTYQTAVFNGRVCARDLSVAEKEREKASAQMNELSRRMETVRIQAGREQLAGLESVTDRCRQELESLQEKQSAMRDGLNLRESMNDYLDYLDDQMKYQSIVETISHAAGGQQELLDLLRQYTSEWQSRYKVKCHELDGRILSARQEMHLNESRRQAAESGERENERLIAVLEHELEMNRAAEKEQMKAFGQLRDQSGLLIIEAVDKEIRDHKKKLTQAETELARTKQASADMALRLQQLQLESEKTASELLRVQQDIEDLSGFMKEWQANRDRLHKLLEVYHVKDTDALRQQIFERYRKLIYEMEARRQQILALENKIRQLQENNPLAVTEDVQRLMEYIRTCHGITCVYGAEYLKNMRHEEREQLLERMPMLPYTVILKDGFSRVAGDVLMQEKDFGDHLIPVTGLETVMSEITPVNGERILFAGKGRRYYEDERLIEKERQRFEEDLAHHRRQLVRMQDQMATYEKDMEDVSGFQLVYDRQKADKQAALAENEAKQARLCGLQKNALEERRELEEQEARLQDQCRQQELEAQSLRERCDILLQLQSVNDELAAIREKIAVDEDKFGQAKAQQQQQQSEMEQLASENRELAKQCQALAGQKETLLHEWTACWQLYAGDETGAGKTCSECQAMTDDELKAAFMGVKDAYEKEHLDLADKKQLLESYSHSMERLLKTIGDRNQRPDRLENMYREGQLYRTPEEQIQVIRDDLRQMEDRVDDLRQKLAVMEADKNKLCGSVSQAVTVIEERYGAYKEVNLNDQSCEAYIQNVARLLDEAADKQSRAARNIERLTRENYYLEGLRRDLERLMAMHHVTAELTKATYGSDTNLKRKYEELLQRHEQLQMQRFARRDAFEKDKSKAVSSLHLLGAVELAAELREHMPLPEDAAAARRVMEGIEETIQLIELEKNRVEKNMTDLLTIKETFENQCLQICQNIRMELDKLPKMSVIMMDGERIQMLGLTIPYIKETFYQQQMSAYIDEIVATADTFGTQEEKMRYIRQQLAWKRLFAVIVTDMNAIRLTLYKRERIREQSRYLKYEEAVGSTGQSQGIYIQFLIAIIHYISCIHAGTSSGEGLKKVIFIDNPFGAAKDIYIWEPIFALLKTNDVQLIVPARGATPAITGKFDVNYVLGQKLMNNRQQTIVVDYHSNIVIEEMEYVKIDYEQEVFDFV